MYHLQNQLPCVHSSNIDSCVYDYNYLCIARLNEIFVSETVITSPCNSSNFEEHPLHDCYTISDNPATKWPPWMNYILNARCLWRSFPCWPDMYMYDTLPCTWHPVCPCTTNILCHQWGLCARPSAVHAMKKLGRTWVWENPKLQILNWHLGTHNILHLAHQTMSQCGTIACSFISVN